MATITNDLPRLLTFRGRLSLIPGECTPVEPSMLGGLWATDRVFRTHVEQGWVSIEGWSPDGIQVAPTPPARDGIGELAIKLQRQAAAAAPPAASARERAGLTPTTVPEGGLRPMTPGMPMTRDSTPSTAPIEPTPMAGVPGNARAAWDTVAMCTDVDTLRAWRTGETRRTVIERLDRRELELTVGAEPAVAVDPSEVTAV